LRRSATVLLPVLDEVLWYLVRARWAVVGRPTALTLLLDSTVVLRYGWQQAGAERGYNPTKPGRPSHHPLLAFTDQGDCLGVRWRGGAAHTAAGAAEWVGTLVGRLRQLGVRDITVRLDKGFCSQALVAHLQALDVHFLLKAPDQAWVRHALGPYRQSEKDPTLWTATGTLHGARLCSVQQRFPLRAPADGEPALALDDYVVPDHGTAHVLTNLPGLHALTVWRQYNAGAVVEQRIKECYQLGFGQTAIDDRDGNALLATLGVLAYQVVHVLRTTTLTGRWRRAQPATLRAWLFRLPARCTTHARKAYVRLLRTEPLRRPLLQALRRLTTLPPPRTERLALA